MKWFFTFREGWNSNEEIVIENYKFIMELMSNTKFETWWVIKLHPEN